MLGVRGRLPSPCNFSGDHPNYITRKHAYDKLCSLARKGPPLQGDQRYFFLGVRAKPDAQNKERMQLG